MKPSKYLMENPKEAKRLEAKVDAPLFVQKYLSHLLVELKGKCNYVLDLGCGCGVITSAIARRYADLQVYGFDLNALRYKEQEGNNLDLENLRFVSGEASKTDFSSGLFSLVFSRFLFEYLRRPDLILEEIVRVTKRRGKILLQDLDGQLIWNYPLSSSLSRKIDRVVSFLKTKNFDPLVGRKLYFLAKQAGLVDVSISIEPYHLFAGRISKKDYKLWDMKLSIALPQISMALGSLRAARLFKKEYLTYLLNENTLTYSNLVTVCGIKA